LVTNNAFGGANFEDWAAFTADCDCDWANFHGWFMFLVEAASLVLFCGPVDCIRWAKLLDLE